MSVSDPLLKQIKAYIVEFRTKSPTITDEHPCLRAFCESLETIFRRGLKQNGSIFGLTRKDYWSWICALAKQSSNYNDYNNRINPTFCMVVDQVKRCKKVSTNQGRGRLFVRIALQKKVLCVPFDKLSSDSAFCQTWYDPTTSLVADEILLEILRSLLFQLTEANFQLNTKNACFLDMTWELPIFKEYELVPCKELGIRVEHIDGYSLVVHADTKGVGYEDRKIEPGDVLDEILGEGLKNIPQGKIGIVLQKNKGFPITLSLVKCRRSDGTFFPAIHELIKQVRHVTPQLQQVMNTECAQTSPSRRPPHALLPEEDDDQVPVHNADDKAVYSALYIGRAEIGTEGGVHRIEGAIGAVTKELQPEENLKDMKKVTVELGETNLAVRDVESSKIIHDHSYTEISSCGRRIDSLEYFAYIAGETTCTLSKQFVAYVFKAEDKVEAKTMLCAIAQGFGRTHWFV